MQVFWRQLDILPPISFNHPTLLRYSPTANLAPKLTKNFRGEFLANYRVTTFLSTLSHYSIHLRLIAGVENLPSDYASHNPNECLDIDVKRYLKDVVMLLTTFSLCETINHSSPLESSVLDGL